MEDEEEEYDEDEDLFVRPDNRPMAFIMSPTGPERQMVGTGYHGVHHVTHRTRETDGRYWVPWRSSCHPQDQRDRW